MAYTIWFTGLSASGKSTLAQLLAQHMQAQGKAHVLLDGDQLRAGLCSDLGFSAQDRRENIRRVAELARLLNHHRCIALVALISPSGIDRATARHILGTERMIEVFVSTPLAACEARDPKGLYRRARIGEIPEFTGVSAPYEAPESPELVLDTSVLSQAQCLDLLVRLTEGR